jgi:hypothetical protein
MTRAEFIRWANRREEAQKALYDARRKVRSMLEIQSGRKPPAAEAACAMVNSAEERITAALADLAVALEEMPIDTKPVSRERERQKGAG